ncbi:hypothetical protein N9K77_01175 [bacterium]|nr:hypothetical protein [bacterium]
MKTSRRTPISSSDIKNEILKNLGSDSIISLYGSNESRCIQKLDYSTDCVHPLESCSKNHQSFSSMGKQILF